MIFHFGGASGDYGVVDEFGLPRLEYVLDRFPALKVLGHSQRFWSLISGDAPVDVWNGYPKGRVAAGGRVVELMRRYGNLCGDLSAGSGYNALSRDPEFACDFIEELIHTVIELVVARYAYIVSHFIHDVSEICTL